MLIALAAIAPTAFPAAQAGYSTLHDLAFFAVIPAAVLPVLAWAFLRNSPVNELATSMCNGALAGALATISLEAVRYSGFRMGFMPGSLPELMGFSSGSSFWREPVSLFVNPFRLQRI